MSLHHERSGRGDPLILVHGLGGDLRVWAPVRDVLAAEHEVIAPDLPGFGGSPPLGASVVPDPPALARAVAGLLDELGLARPDVAGNSLGAWVALELARLGRARTVTALSPAGFWPRPLAPNGAVAHRVARVLLPALKVAAGTAAGRRRVLGSTLAHPERMPPEAARRVLDAYATAPGFEAVNAAMRASHFTGAEEVDVPVTLAWGDRDHLVTPPAHPPVRWRTVTMPGCGHLCMWDDPELVARVVLDTSGQPAIMDGQRTARRR
jgi:pimeloyl-ACP methyl ester carboxylesterase